ncbi:probetacellulin [Spea bombifrons]|uniref:probetacellulin n=1 Tax=Spea bombifrons TaxID=233779 RepID=UPI00234AD35C|nr:probetacellulin [Spea bombifrons]
MCAGQAQIDGRLVTEHLLLALILGLTVWPCVSSDGNSESEEKLIPCSEFTENCTDTSISSKWSGHFSRCPKQYRYYCYKGKCRFVTSENTPACICEPGYTGSRCEYLDLFYLKGDRGQLVVVVLIAAMLTLVILIVCICVCSHHWRKVHRQKKKATEVNTMENDFTVKMEETHLA